MGNSGSARRSLIVAAISVTLTAGSSVLAATRSMDLDGNAANGAESQVDLNVLQTFPVMIENKVTNRTAGDSFRFEWPSAGPGGFTSGVTGGTTGGVGAKWVWTTNQAVYSFTGSSCATDACFAQTGGPSNIPSTCNLSCIDDGVHLVIAKGATPAETLLSWPTGQGPFTIYRSSSAATVISTANVVGTTDLLRFTDNPPAGSIYFYAVTQAVTQCAARKSCVSNADCNPVTEGTCTGRGPFGVPGRSLLANNVTVSAASLTSSLITFFSPPLEVFRVTNSVEPAPAGVAYQQGFRNMGTQDVTAIVGAYPPGCCNQAHQLNCDGTCVNYLADNDNCGACGNACGEGFHCDNGNCRITCSEDTYDCDGVCVNLKTDRNNCGTCGNACSNHAVCISFVCYDCYGPNDVVCDNECVDLGSNAHNCGSCGNDCDAYCDAPQVGACNKEIGCYCVDPGDFAGTSGSSGGVAVPPASTATNTRPAAPQVEEAPICELPETTTTVPAGASITSCNIQSVLAKEVPTSIAICGSGIPDGNARCANGDPATQGTFMKLIPDPLKVIGEAYPTPLAIHITDPGNDGLIQGGENIYMVVEVLNAGPATIQSATATLVSPPIDLSDDGISNPVAVIINPLPISFGDIIGTPPGEGDCNTPRRPLAPAKNLLPFQITFPPEQNGDVSRPFTLQFAGIVDGSPFLKDMQISVGIADRCNYDEKSGDFDGLDGLMEPMAKLVPVGDDIPLPHKNFKLDAVIPLELRQLCGGVNLTDEDVDTPQIIGLDESKLGPLDITQLILNDDTGNNSPFFHYDGELGHWVFHLRTAGLDEGRYTLHIRIASRKEYVASFILENEE
jgi:hypothetical protein